MSLTSSSFFVLNDGTVKACGLNNNGQLGIGNTTNQLSPVTVPISNVKQIACGSYHTVFLLNDGTVKAVGNNANGQLGIGNTTNQLSPVTVPISNVKQIACGFYHTVFLLNDGTVKAVGNNANGQLGIGNTTNQLSPVTVPISNVKQIACGSYHTVFLLNDGTVKAVGNNANGQLGIGNTTNQLSPVTVPISNVKQITCGGYHTVFLLNDGTVKAVGNNANGQLGIGNTTNQTSLVTVPISNAMLLWEVLITYLTFISPNKVISYSNAISNIIFNRNNITLGSINNPIVNQSYNILDYIDPLTLNYKDVLVVEGYDSNNNLLDSLILNVKEDFTGKQGILATINSIDTKDWSSIDFIQAIGDLYSGDLVPALTSNTSATPIVVSASSIYSSTYGAWKAFNNTVADLYDCWATASNTVTGWLKVDFGNPKIVNKYTVTARDTMSAPKNWTFEGSNDNTNWVVLDTRTNEINWLQSQKREYTFNNTTAYRYYRINITANNGNTVYVVIGEMELMCSVYNCLLSNDNKQTWYTYKDNQFIPVTNPATDIFTQGITDLSALPPLTKQNFLTDKLDIMVGLKSDNINENPVIKSINITYTTDDFTTVKYSYDGVLVDNLVPVLTSNTSASPIVVSASTEYVGVHNYHAYNAFDGVTNTEYNCWSTANGVLSGWLKVDFGTDIIVNMYKITARISTYVTQTPKTWTFEGSNDDINWTVLDTRASEVGWTGYETRSYVFDNVTPYRYYRINITANNGATDVISIEEMQLLLDNTKLPQFVCTPDVTEEVYKYTINIDGDNYKVFLSKDGGNTWLTYNGTDFIEGGEGNYIWEINNLSEELLMQFLPISNFRLKFEPIDSSAILNSITINYSVKTNSISPSDAKEALLPVPPEYFRNVLQEDNTYTLKLEEGLSFDDANKDYDFYTTPTKVKLRPLDMGTVIGNKWSVVQAFEVINSHENQDYDIELKVAYNNEEAIIKDNTALLNDTDLDSEKTIVEFSLTQDPFEIMYPVKFRLDRNSKQVVYFKIKPTIVTEGTKTFQIRLTATPL